MYFRSPVHNCVPDTLVEYFAATEDFDPTIAMTYQHPELEIVRDAINSRHTLRHTGETIN